MRPTECNCTRTICVCDVVVVGSAQQIPRHLFSDRRFTRVADDTLNVLLDMKKVAQSSHESSYYLKFNKQRVPRKMKT